MAIKQLVYFEVTGFYIDVEQPDLVGDTNEPELRYINAFIDFIPRVPQGFTINVAGLSTLINGKVETLDTAIALSTITARLHLGKVSTIDPTDVEGIRLIANSPELQEQLTAAGINDGELIYDVRFRQVTYANGDRILKNFSFVASHDDSPINLTDPTLQRGAYQGP